MQYQLISPMNPDRSAVEQVMSNRGIAPQDIEHYLNTGDCDLFSPELFSNIDKGLKMLISHIAQNDDIFIQVDSDCDGYTSAALLINYLNCLFPHFVQSHISYRIHDGKQHGLLVDTIPENIKLVIAPDSSSNDFEQHQKLAERGIDVLVIDHHEADEFSQYACIINNQTCDYPNKTLSGAGVVYKFCCYIDSQLDKNFAERFLDLAAVGIIGDMMDLKDYETKEIITRGMASIKNPFLKTMVAKNAFSFKGDVNPHKVSFFIAPLINAITRTGTQEEKTLIFEAMLDFKAYRQIPSTKRGCSGQFETMVDQAIRTCTNVKNRQTKIQETSLEIIETLIKEQNLLDNKILVVKLDPQHAVNKNLTGLIGNKLVAEYQRPALILNYVVHKGEDGMADYIAWEGSGRGYDKSNLESFRDFLNSTGLVEYAQGHANAMGVGILDSNIDRFIEYSNEALKDFDFSPSYKVDLIYQDNDFKSKDVLDLAKLESVWGQGIEKPLVVIENIKVTKNNLTLLSKDKNPTLKITLNNGVELMKFKSSEEEFELLYSDLGYVIINAVGYCDINAWMGNITAQIKMEEYEIIGQ